MVQQCACGVIQRTVFNVYICLNHSLRDNTTNLKSVMKNQDIKGTFFQNLERKCITSGAQPDLSQGRGGLVGLGHFHKHFLKNTRRKAHAGKNVGIFSPRYP